jgi:hypothetical protein
MQPAAGAAPRPGPIANASLLPPSAPAAAPDPIATGLLPSAFGEDTAAPPPSQVPLRRDPPLVEQQDFVAVTRATWDYLSKLYGGGPAISRRTVTARPPVSLVAAAAGVAPQPHKRLVLYPLVISIYSDASPKLSATIEVDPQVRASPDLIMCQSALQQACHVPARTTAPASRASSKPTPPASPSALRRRDPNAAARGSPCGAQASLADLKATGCKALDLDAAVVELWDSVGELSPAPPGSQQLAALLGPPFATYAHARSNAPRACGCQPHRRRRAAPPPALPPAP